MNTYCEKKGHDYIDWNARLARAHEASAEELKRWVEDARDWVTCACGNQCEAIPRTRKGVPLDGALYSLGSMFAAMMRLLYELPADRTSEFGKKRLHTHIEDATEILRSIELRSAQILAEIGGAK